MSFKYLLNMASGEDVINSSSLTKFKKQRKDCRNSIRKRYNKEQINHCGFHSYSKQGKTKNHKERFLLK
jgi:hypothetical protein